MGIMQLSMFSLLTDKMRWHQTRQGVLAENVANAETPGFQAHELKPFDVSEAASRAGFTPMMTTATQPHPRVAQSRAWLRSCLVVVVILGHTNCVTHRGGLRQL